MSAVVLEKKIVFNSEGDPVEVIIPYAQFVAFAEAYGLDLTKTEVDAIHEAEADRVAGKRDAFISLDELEKELACTE